MLKCPKCGCVFDFSIPSFCNKCGLNLINAKIVHDDANEEKLILEYLD